ncbi:hypothetical protein P3T76_011204 [Phytophthora citrophthora]|uniref:Uncharacterized protein n=1 Tax=Phytophthora citrophthora TaxID=4793 RepID=A0AAD9LFF2_9STRA|nr:hypothetical protein P3T76_011204 [Phytophthora citrophthora]
MLDAYHPKLQVKNGSIYCSNSVGMARIIAMERCLRPIPPLRKSSLLCRGVYAFFRRAARNSNASYRAEFRMEESREIRSRKVALGHSTRNHPARRLDTSCTGKPQHKLETGASSGDQRVLEQTNRYANLSSGSNFQCDF